MRAAGYGAGAHARPPIDQVSMMCRADDNPALACNKTPAAAHMAVVGLGNPDARLRLGQVLAGSPSCMSKASPKGGGAFGLSRGCYQGPAFWVWDMATYEDHTRRSIHDSGIC